MEGLFTDFYPLNLCVHHVSVSSFKIQATLNCVGVVTRYVHDS